MEFDGLEQRLEGLTDLSELGFRRVVGGVKCSLGNDWPLIEVGGDIVGGNARDTDAFFDGLHICPSTGECRQQGRMHIDNAVLVPEDHVGTEDPDVSREGNQIDTIFL